MINLFPCFIWPLVLLAGYYSFRMWKNRPGFKLSWLIPVSFFIGGLILLWTAVWLRFDEFWLDGLFLVYIPQ